MMQQIDKDWGKIIDRFDILEMIESKLQETKLGLIELDRANSSDAQTTFKIINTAGTPLSAPEILSAKPSWNKQINNPSNELEIKVKELYNSIGTTTQNFIVKWDIAATFADRIKPANGFIFQELGYKDKSEFSKKITLGFKLISGVFEGGISKNHIEKLPENQNICWDHNIEKLINDFKTICKLLDDVSFFRFFKSWKKSFMELTSDAIAIDFMLLTYLDWKRKGEPIGTSSKVFQFTKNAIVLFDQLIYEYITRQWRGSSDAIIAENIRKFPSLQDLYQPIEKIKWIDLITSTIDEHKIGSSLLKTNEIDRYLKPILYYYYVLKSQKGPDDFDSIEVVLMLI